MKKRVHPAVAGLVFIALVGLIYVVYTTVGKNFGSTGHELTAEERARAAATIKNLEAHGMGSPALRQPGEPQPFTDMTRKTHTAAWLAWDAAKKKTQATQTTTGQ